MGPFLRKVKTASGATVVQLAERKAGRDRVLGHLGSAHTDAELAALMLLGRERLYPGQGMLEVPIGPAGTVPGSAVVTASSSRLLIEVVTQAWKDLGFGVVMDGAFFQLVLARVVEPTSVLDAGRVLTGLGVAPKHRNSFLSALKRCQDKGYRDHIAASCFNHASTRGDVSLVLYDVTTLYFEAEKEDDLRKVGYSKERCVDPQIVVGLLVDRDGFPLEIGCCEGNKAETARIILIVRAFQQRHRITDMVVVADAGMLSAANLKGLDEASLRFIVGSRVSKAPNDLASHFRWHGDAFTEAQIIDTITPQAGSKSENSAALRAEPMWDRKEHSTSWRAVWAYSTKRSVRDSRTLTAQENKAKAVIAGEKTARTPRFVRTDNGTQSLDEASLARARRLVGLKGYVTNIPATVMPASEIISSYHALWQVEQSFRMSKTDLRARPMFSHLQDSIKAHLTVVFTALAIARHLQNQTGSPIRHIVRTLRPLQHVTINIASKPITAEPQIPEATQEILDSLTH